MSAYIDLTAASAEEFDARLDAIEAAEPAPESWEATVEQVARGIWYHRITEATLAVLRGDPT